MQTQRAPDRSSAYACRCWQTQPSNSPLIRYSFLIFLLLPLSPTFAPPHVVHSTARFVPSSYHSNRVNRTPAPLVLAFHGFANTALDVLTSGQLEGVAEEKGFVLASHSACTHCTLYTVHCTCTTPPPPFATATLQATHEECAAAAPICSRAFRNKSST